NPHWDLLFNSYYDKIGPQYPRHERGLLTRPTVREIYSYRAAIDEELQALLRQGSLSERVALANVAELGLHHEQQHQELLLTDLQHAFSKNPLRPAYRPGIALPLMVKPAEPQWLLHRGGLVTVGHDGTSFAFDNESPKHHAYLEPFEMSFSP